MQPSFQPTLFLSLGGILLTILYLAFVIGVIVFVLKLMIRFVRAHERMADALEASSRRLRDGGQG